MEFSQIVFLVILLATLVLLVSEWIRLDVTAMLALVALVVTGILKPAEALAGFGSEPAIAVAAVFVLSAGLAQTGVTERLGDWIGRLAGASLWRATLVIMLAVAAMSAFTHHLMITAMMLPVTLAICARAGLPPSRLLMPMSLAASFGTTLTVIGAPAFLIAAHILGRDGGPGLGIFSLTPIGLAIAGVATLFMLTAGRLLLPAREGRAAGDDHFRLDGYYTEIVVQAGQAFIGKPLAEFRKAHEKSFEVVDWLRHGQPLARPFEDCAIEEHDVLLVRSTPDLLASIAGEPGLALHAVAQYGKDLPKGHAEEVHGDERLVQVVLAPNSNLVGRTIGSIGFKDRYGVIVVGLWRKRGWLRRELSRIKLKAGDALVLWGESEQFAKLPEQHEFLMTVPFHGKALRRERWLPALAIMAASVLLAATEVLPVQIAFLAGAVAMVLSGCLTPVQAYGAIETRVFVFIAGAIPLGMAMEKTGVSALFASFLVEAVSGWSPWLILFALFVSAALLTQILSDAATVVLLGPVALGMAGPLGLPPEPLVVCAAIGAVAAVLTPIGHHGNLLIYAPGNYRFGDFVRVGAPLTLLIAVVTCSIALLLWPVK